MIKNEITLLIDKGSVMTYITFLNTKLNIAQADYLINVEKKWGMKVLSVT
jgi:hypothetical protein